MSTSKTITRLVACHGSIQLVTVLSVLGYREKKQQELNVNYENYLVITPLWACQEQNDEFADVIEKMAKSICSWEKIVYVNYELQNQLIAKTLNSSGLSETSSLVHELLGVKSPDELYLSREWMFINQLLMNIYESAEKICYGDGIGIYCPQSAFPPPSSPKSSHTYLKNMYASLKEKIKVLFPKYKSIKERLTPFFPPKTLLREKEFDVGYFSIPYAFNEVPPMKTVILDRTVFLNTLQSLRETLDSLIDINYLNGLRTIIQDVPTSILLTSNFSEAVGRMSMENEVAAYREFLEAEVVPANSILLIKPHPRDSKLKILKLKSVLSDLYADIFLLSEESLFYLPFELFFMEVFLNPDGAKVKCPKIFTFSSACLTLEFLFNAQCTVGFGSNIVEKFFYQDQVFSRLKHEADLISTIREIRHLNDALIFSGR
jgi:hypothetical protein